jgi:hypothetical protein
MFKFPFNPKDFFYYIIITNAELCIINTYFSYRYYCGIFKSNANKKALYFVFDSQFIFYIHGFAFLVEA